jgi:hypothetical protein
VNTTKVRTQNIGHIFQKRDRGMIFSLDAGVAFTITLIGILLFTNTFANSGQRAVENTESIEVEEKTLMIADALVKNYDENNTLLGSCVVDYEKKRVKSNELTLENIKKAKPIELGNIFVEEIRVNTELLKETIKLEEKKSNECYSVKRFVLIDNEKGTIEVKTCKEE